MSRDRIKVGVVGCGVIAQTMHLPYLKELGDCFDVRALCDQSHQVVHGCGARFGVERTFTDWRHLVEEDLDAVFVLTSGSHAPIAMAAAALGRHCFVEKPLCYSVSEGRQLLDVAGGLGVTVMVGYPKRYDPAYHRARDQVRALADLRFVRLTTLESPFQPYVAQYPQVRGDDIDAATREEWRTESARRVDAALGPVDDSARRTYEMVLLDSMVHEFNLLRGILGEPTELRYVSLRDASVLVVLDFAGVECVVACVDLPGMAKWEMEACFYDPNERVTLSFPSPYLRNAPSFLDVETGEAGTPRWRRWRELTSYESPFKLELVEFHRVVTTGEAPETSALDALADVALCQNVIASATRAAAISHPTRV